MKRFLPLGMLSIALILPASVVLPRDLNAQELSSVKGGLGGSITDSTGASIAGAKVTLSGDADTRIVTTDSTGRFTVGSLTPGKYKVTVEKEGFSTTETKNVEVVINRISSLNLVLAAGAVTQTVEVDATASEVDTGSTAISTNLNSTFYSQVPVPRNVGALMYVAPGVTGGGGTGNSNPSIGGATGLENSYVADGVSINDAGYGGLGVYSPNYGSLGSGINLSFIEEVQVKTGAFEPKYGGINGGSVQIVTKSGGTQYHGALSAYFAPEFAGAQYRYADSYRTFAPQLERGYIYSSPAFDGAAELGGYIPVAGHHDKLFFFAAYNPSLDQVNYLAADSNFAAPIRAHGPFATSITTNNWAAKLTYKINDNTSLEASGFGDPSRSNYAFGGMYTDPFGYNNMNIRTESVFSRWNYGTKNVVARLTSTLSAKTQLSLSASYKGSHFTETGFSNTYNVSDRTDGIEDYQGLGEFQNPDGKQYGVAADLQQIVTLFGQHTLSIGWNFTRNIYNSSRDYSGARFNFPTTNADGTAVTTLGLPAYLNGAAVSAALRLYKAPGCSPQYCPLYISPDDATQTPNPVVFKQIRGIFSSPDVNSSQGYHALYGNDNWAVNRYITLNVGLRWEEEQLNGPNQQYVFNDNWSPRLGINVDPFANGKSKVFFNWGRYTQALPTDAAIRELNQETDINANTVRWAVPQDANHNVLTNPDGTITPVFDAAHLLNQVAGTGITAGIGATPATPELIHTGTLLNYEEEYVAGAERQVGGFVISARYTDRRLKRIVEDMQGVSPEGADGQTNDFLLNQIYVIGNPSPSADYFVNENEETYDPNGAAPANCTADYGVQEDTLGNVLGAACDTSAQPNSANNPYTGPGNPINSPGWNASDGKPDGFATPVRHYQALEIEANKNFSHNFLVRANYRFAKLYGNYEGLFRNDNQQSDPGISSLFDFTPGKLGLLGAQFTPGYLNTDRRDIGNIFASYTVPNGIAKRLTGGFGLRAQTGTPLNYLGSHPVYGNTGEIPLGGRGTGGTLPTTFQADLHGDYSVPVGERFHVKLGFDAFNVADWRLITYKNQNIDTGFQAAPDVTGPNYAAKTPGTPVQFQRPFYARGSIRFEF